MAKYELFRLKESTVQTHISEVGFWEGQRPSHTSPHCGAYTSLHIQLIFALAGLTLLLLAEPSQNPSIKAL